MIRRVGGVVGVYVGEGGRRYSHTSHRSGDGYLSVVGRGGGWGGMC